MEKIRCKHCGGMFQTSLPVKTGFYMVDCPICGEPMVFRVVESQDYITVKCPNCKTEKKAVAPFLQGSYGLRCEKCGREIIVNKK